MKSLFQYTSINKLALILSSKKIRFNRLDFVNDPHEGKTGDFGSMAMYVFVSCWTKHQEENLALWNMYTEKMRGVRIELPLPIFNSYKIDDYSDYIITEQEMLNDRDELFILDAQNNPIDIVYTNNEDELRPKIQNEIGLKTSTLGVAKKTIWSVENESRYRMQIFPYDPLLRETNFPEAYGKFIDQKIPPSINFYEVKINKNSFEKMRIVVGPKVQPGDEKIIDALVSKYNPTAEIILSKLSNEIR
ncbi:MAG TPA: hypothetical protein DER09_15560 [Prolixibacteraceae bacterium]|nr:hypothetical protein [Prolixibacteraceae bacterium]